MHTPTHHHHHHPDWRRLFRAELYGIRRILCLQLVRRHPFTASPLTYNLWHSIAFITFYGQIKNERDTKPCERKSSLLALQTTTMSISQGWKGYCGAIAFVGSMSNEIEIVRIRVCLWVAPGQIIIIPAIYNHVAANLALWLVTECGGGCFFRSIGPETSIYCQKPHCIVCLSV